LAKWGQHFFHLLFFLSVLAYVNVLLLSNPRVMLAMSGRQGASSIPSNKITATKRSGWLKFNCIPSSYLYQVILFFAKRLKKF